MKSIEIKGYIFQGALPDVEQFSWDSTLKETTVPIRRKPLLLLDGTTLYRRCKVTITLLPERRKK